MPPAQHATALRHRRRNPRGRSGPLRRLGGASSPWLRVCASRPPLQKPQRSTPVSRYPFDSGGPSHHLQHPLCAIRAPARDMTRTMRCYWPTGASHRSALAPARQRRNNDAERHHCTGSAESCPQTCIDDPGGNRAGGAWGPPSHAAEASRLGTPSHSTWTDTRPN